MIGGGLVAEEGAWATPVVGGERFSLRVGASGRRYVFSRLDDAIDDGELDGAVVALAEGGRVGGSRLLWIGAGEDLPVGRPAPGRQIHVHWLAETAAERARVIADLGAVVGGGEGTGDRMPVAA